MDFSAALKLLKEGKCLSRLKWENKCVELSKGNYAIDLPGDKRLSFIDSDLFRFGDNGTSSRTPHFRLEKDGVITDGWVPSQEDLLAEDWYEDRS